MTPSIEAKILVIEQETGIGANTKLRIGEVLREIANEKPYKVYTALLTQTGTNAPVATVLENTLGNIVWSYDNEARFSATSNNLFTLNKTVVFTGSVFNGSVPNSVDILIDNNNFTTTTLNMKVTFDEGVVANDLLSNTPIEIRVYN